MAPPSDDSPEVAAADDERTEKQLLVECLNRLSDFVLESKPKPPDPIRVRSEKLEKLYGFIIKHTKLKDYRPNDSVDFRLWLHQLETAIDSIASAGCNLDLSTEPLTDVEFIKLLKAKISYQVETEILQSLIASGLDWTTASIDNVKTAMQNLYSRREPKVSSVLKLFSRDRLMKGNLSVAAYYAKWKEGLAPSLVCTTDEEKIQCYDLFMRSAFYYGLDDSYIQREVFNIKESD